MSVTDAQFSRWIRGQSSARPTLLAEIHHAYEIGGVQAIGTIYLSDLPYRTELVRYLDVIKSSPQFERAIDVKKLGGRGTMSIGAFSLANTGARSEFLLDPIIDGREVRFYYGDETWPRSDFRLVNVAVIAAVKSSDHETTVELRDKSFLLDDTIIGDVIATGPNAGKHKPIILGGAYNVDVTPYLFDSSALKYYVNNFALQADQFGAITVRDQGVSLDSGIIYLVSSASLTATPATDTLTRAAHGLAVNDVIVFTQALAGTFFTGLSLDTQYWVIAAGLTANDFRLSLTKGGAAVDITGSSMTATLNVFRRRFHLDTATAVLQLSSTPAGRVTYDLGVVPAVGVGGTTPHHWFKYILQNYTQLSADEYDDAALSSLSALETAASLGWGRSILDRENVLEILDEISFDTFAWYGWNASGVLTVGRLALPDLDTATPTDTINEDDISGGLSCENLSLPWGKVVLNANRNAVVQTDGLATSVSAEDKSKYTQQFQTRVSTTDPGTNGYLANWWDYHKSAIDSKPLNSTVVANVSVVQTVVDEITDNFKPWTRVYRATVGIDKYELNPGACVRLTYPRYGLEAGANVRVMSVKPKFSERECDLVMVRQVTPDYTTASYN